ncbi:phage minor head protein [Flexivirga sp.]|uniref:phage minor head protein n=1 Tax=Flexivirga sp. TaxID=1962927 RepID=UPI003F7CE66C
MAVSRETLRLANGLRIAILATLDATDAAILRAWGSAWDELAHEWDAAISDLVAASKDGKWPSAAKIRRAKRAQNALAVTREALVELGKQLPITVAEALPKTTQEAADWQRRLASSQLPAGAKDLAMVDPDALAAIVKRTTEQVTSLSRPLSVQAEAAMRAALIRGVAVGDNPRTVGADMLRRVQGGFDGGRARATMIARTEMLDAHRAASLAQNKANADVLTGWEWLSALDKRTCPACWAQHGTFHRIDERGPDGHQQCRCTRLPATQSWKDLGFNIEEPDSLMPSAQDVFNSMPREDQLAVMGKTRLDLLDSGSVDWSDLAVKRENPGWRPSWVPTPVSNLAS